MTGLVALLVAHGCSIWVDGDRFREDGSDEDEGDEGNQGDDTPDPGGGAQGDGAPSGRDAGGEVDAGAVEECVAGCEECGEGCCTETCGNGPCDLRCERTDCHCELDCAATQDMCNARCDKASCTIDCSDVNNCHPRCKEGDCEIDCSGANNCDKAECTDGAGCLLDCTGANNCRFERCEGEMTSCAGDILACNRDCP
ncbi:MAG TPA: hypothetical protein VNO33_21270 [Kofleriaceae bacterium]|nr:hypothetical protein [Kofleriaceae bacterium]